MIPHGWGAVSKWMWRNFKNSLGLQVCVIFYICPHFSIALIHVLHMQKLCHSWVFLARYFWRTCLICVSPECESWGTNGVQNHLVWRFIKQRRKDPRHLHLHAPSTSSVDNKWELLALSDGVKQHSELSCALCVIRSGRNQTLYSNTYWYCLHSVGNYQTFRGNIHILYV